MEEDRFRNKIYWFTFLFSVLVIWVHSANAELYLGRTETEHFLFAFEDFVGNVIAQIAVPGFFMISAYLFYRKFSPDQLKRKWDSRFRTVLIPFVVWNFLYYIGYAAASRIDGLNAVVGKGVVPLDVMTAGDAILHYTYNYVFWYMYQLILLILLAPVIYWVIKEKYRAAAAACVLLFAIQKGYRLMYLNLDALLYYGTAAYFALHGRGWAEAGWKEKRLGIGTLLGIIGIFSLAFYWRGTGIVYLVLFRLFLPVSLWLMVNEKKLPKARSWMKDTFFLYATHFAIVRLINKTGVKISQGNFLVPLLLYLFMPALCVLISSILAVFLKKACPWGWLLLTGGRNGVKMSRKTGEMSESTLP